MTTPRHPEFLKMRCSTISLATSLLIATTAQAATPGAAVLGDWSRTPEACKHPEFQLHATDIALQISADGSPATFDFPHVTWTEDAQAQVTVELNRPHPYGKAISKTALTFKVIGPDDIELVQRTHPVPLHRCHPR